MADLEAVSCTNGWVYLHWEIPAGVTRYRIFRTDLTAHPVPTAANETQVFDSQGNGGVAGRHVSMLVSPNAPGAVVPAMAHLGRFFPFTFAAGTNPGFRLMRRPVAPQTGNVEVADAGLRITSNPPLDGLVVSWPPQYGGGGAAGPLWLEWQDFQAPRATRGWRIIASFDESDADNVRFGTKRIGVFMDAAADTGALAAGHRLRYRIHHTPTTIADRTVELQHDWHFPEKLAFMMDDTADFTPERLWFDGTAVVPYYDHRTILTVPGGIGPIPSGVVIGTRYDHAAAQGAGAKARYYLSNAAEKHRFDVLIPDAEAAGGLIQTVTDTFGGHHVTAGHAQLTALLMPTDGLGWAFGARDNQDVSAYWDDMIGNRRALVVLAPYPAGTGEQGDADRHGEAIFSHEYTHLNYHRAYRARTGTHDPNDEWRQDNVMNEGSGFFAEDVVDRMLEVWARARMEGNDVWEQLWLFYAEGVPDPMYGRGCAWLMYNANRLRQTAAVRDYTYANIPRPWNPAGSPAGGFAQFYREFSLLMMMNGHAAADTPLPLLGWTGPTPGSTANELAATLKRTNTAGGANVVKTARLRDWTVPPHAFGHGRSVDDADLPHRFRVTADLGGRTVASHYWRQITIRHASAYYMSFAPPPFAFKGNLHVELRIAGGNPGQVRRLLATARRPAGVGGGAAPAWEYREVAQATNTLLAVPDYGTKIDLVQVCVPTEHAVPTNATTATAPQVTLDWNFYVTARPVAWALGVVPADAWRGGDTVLLNEPGAGPPAGAHDAPSFVPPGQLRPWVLFNQGMDEGRHFQARFTDSTEVALDRDAYKRTVVDKDCWRGNQVQIAAAAARDGQSVTFEIGRATRTGATVNDGVRSFAGVYLDTREDRTPDAAPAADARFVATIDSAGPVLEPIQFTNGDGVSGVLAAGQSLVGVVSLEIDARDDVSGVAAIEIVGRRQTSAATYGAGRRVMVPNAADGRYAARVIETFYWNTSAAANGPIDIEVMVTDRVGNVTRRTVGGTVVRNPRPGAAVVAGALQAVATSTPVMDVRSVEHDGGTGRFAALAAAGHARGVLRFTLSTLADTENAQLVIKARTPTVAVDEEIWSEWIAGGGIARSRTWTVDSRAIPDGAVTFSFVLRDEAGGASPAAPFAFVVANRPPRIIPIEPRVTTRGPIDLWGYVDDRNAPVVAPGTMKARWTTGTQAGVERELAAFPGGSFLRRAAMHPVHGPAGGWHQGPGELRFEVTGADPAPLPLVVLHDLGDWRPVPWRVVRLTAATTVEPTRFIEVTCPADPAVLVEAAGGTTRVRFQVLSEAPVEPSGVTLTFAPASGGGNVTFGAVSAEGNLFSATATAADGRQGRGVLTVQARDTVGNEATLELPLWVVKAPLAAADVHVRYEAQDMPAESWLPRIVVRRVTAADTAPIVIGGTLCVDVTIGELGLHLRRVEAVWKPDGGGAEVSIGPLGRSETLADAWDGGFRMMYPAPDGNGTWAIDIEDHYGNVARQEFPGFLLDATAPAAGITAVQFTAASPSIPLAPVPSDAGSGMAETILRVEGLDGAGAVVRQYVRVVAGASLALDPVVPGAYEVTIWSFDRAGNVQVAAQHMNAT